MSEYRIDVFKGIDRERLDKILNGIKKIKIGFMGDLCLDIYWKADMIMSKLSRETPHFPLPVVEENISLGAGGNVVSNITALNPGGINVIGVIGKDWRGDILKRELQKIGIDTETVIVSEKSITNAYCKPIRKGISNIEYEDPRIDFSNYIPLSKKDEEGLIVFLENLASKVDLLCVADQFESGCITPLIRDKIIELAKQGLRVVVDSRDRIGLFTNVILKPNDLEAYRAIYGKDSYKNQTFKEKVEIARILAERNNCQVCMTLGSKGCLYVDKDTMIHIPSYDVDQPIDICGAGDTFISSFSCALAAGAEPHEAAAFGNLAANVTIAKIGTTGTASSEEIRNRHMMLFD